MAMSEPYDPNRPSNWDSRPSATEYTGPPVGLNQPYPDQPFAAPGYGPAGYGPAGYGPVAFGAQPYPAPGYSIYPMPGAWNAGRPGQVAGAAVLSYIESGLLIITGLILFSGSSAVSSWSHGSHTSDRGWGAQFAVAGFGDLVAAALLITGAVAFSGGRPFGRLLLSVGLGVCVAEAIFWMAKLSDANGAILPWVAFFLAMPVIATAMSYSSSVKAWLTFTATQRIAPYGTQG